MFTLSLSLSLTHSLTHSGTHPSPGQNAFLWRDSQSKNPLPFIETEESFLCSQKLAAVPYPKQINPVHTSFL